ncbi:MAG: hypothetical protein SGI87_10035 [Flavobacteriales bacterium]|nr:hypothetical protein [Flavobacteriales bacterium]
MNSNPEAIIIVNFDFPPNQGIGGRRWAKLAKGLAMRGVKVFVIKADPIKGNKTSSWQKDVSSSNIEIHSIPRMYPQSISHPKRTVLNKIRYVSAMRNLRKKEKGTLYDVAIGWSELLQSKLNEIVSTHKTNVLIATGAPFNALYYCALFAKKNPNLKFVADYRDPWLTAKNYGMPFLSDQAKAEENRKQDFVFGEADIVISPYRELTDKLVEESSHLTLPNISFQVLPHFYDEDDTKNAQVMSVKDQVLSFVYGGALYTGTKELIADWVSYLDSCRENQPELYSRVHFKIFTDNLIESEAFANHSCVTISPTIGSGIFAEMAKATFCLVISADYNKNQFTTKFFEYLPLRKPFLYLGPEGELSQFIESNKLGLRISDFHKDIPKLIEQYDSDHLDFNGQFDISNYTLVAATERLLKMIR